MRVASSLDDVTAPHDVTDVAAYRRRRARKEAAKRAAAGTLHALVLFAALLLGTAFALRSHPASCSATSPVSQGR